MNSNDPVADDDKCRMLHALLHEAYHHLPFTLFQELPTLSKDAVVDSHMTWLTGINNKYWIIGNFLFKAGFVENQMLAEVYTCLPYDSPLRVMCYRGGSGGTWDHGPWDTELLEAMEELEKRLLVLQVEREARWAVAEAEKAASVEKVKDFFDQRLKNRKPQ